MRLVPPLLSVLFLCFFLILFVLFFFFYCDGAHRDLHRVDRRQRQMCIRDSPIGSAGPTTASRMDKYTPALLDLGLQGMIGKGKRTEAVKQAMIRNTAVYFAAVGGAGCLLYTSDAADDLLCVALGGRRTI